MASLNKAIVLGRLGRDPEVKYTASKQAVANLSIATESKFKNKAGENQTETEWHQVTVFGRSAENAAKYLKKGSQLYVEGRLHTRSYEDKNGQTKYSTSIISENIVFIGDYGSKENKETNQFTSD